MGVERRVWPQRVSRWEGFRRLNESLEATVGQTQCYALVKTPKAAHRRVTFTICKEKANHLTMTYLEIIHHTGRPPLTALCFIALHRNQVLKKN